MGTAIQAWDASVMLWVQEYLRSGMLTAVLVPLTKMGSAGVLWIVISLFLTISRRTRKAGALALAAMAVCYCVNDLIIKNLICRPRPFLTVDGLTTLVTRPTSWSCPSGHSCSAFAAVSCYVRGLKTRWAKGVFIVLAVLMAFSRVYVGVHYPTDVLLGALVGFLGGTLVWRWASPVYERRLSR